MDNHNEKQSDNAPALGSDGYTATAILLYVTAIGALIYAFILGYQDSTFSTEIVGGDAYNYLIFTSRALIFAVAGVLSAILGLGCQLARLAHIVASK